LDDRLKPLNPNFFFGLELEFVFDDDDVVPVDDLDPNVLDDDAPDNVPNLVFTIPSVTDRLPVLLGNGKSVE
jgi:hypothetical protein